METGDISLDATALDSMGVDFAGEQISAEIGTKRIAVLIPAYNEERFIGSVVLKAKRYADTVIVVDDGSTDETALIASIAGAHVISHPNNCGKAAALNTGFRYARELNLEVLITLDGDGQHTVDEMMQVAAPILNRQADLVIGSRYLDQVCDIPRHRAWGHVLINFLTGTLSNLYISDSQSGYRAFSSRAINELYFHSNGFLVESEMQFLAHKMLLRTVEAPITVHYQDKPKRPVLTHGLLVLSGLIFIAERYKPTLFFGFCGLICLLVGFFFGFDFASDSVRVVFSPILLIVGILATFSAIILHPIQIWFSDLEATLGSRNINHTIDRGDILE
jgi:glycosyltransferase involved in cell wall biosynthesis